VISGNTGSWVRLGPIIKSSTRCTASLVSAGRECKYTSRVTFRGRVPQQSLHGPQGSSQSVEHSGMGMPQPVPVRPRESDLLADRL